MGRPWTWSMLGVRGCPSSLEGLSPRQRPVTLSGPGSTADFQLPRPSDRRGVCRSLPAVMRFGTTTPNPMRAVWWRCCSSRAIPLVTTDLVLRQFGVGWIGDLQQQLLAAAGERGLGSSEDPAQE